MSSVARWTPQEYDAYMARHARSVNAPSASLPEKRRNKYGAITVEADGQVFDSKREYSRWTILRRRELAGEIRGLQHHVPYPIVVNGVHVCDYEADFAYFTSAEVETLVVEDVKNRATKTPLYGLKKRLIKALYDVDIQEVP